MADGVTEVLNQGIRYLASGGTLEEYMRQTDLSGLSPAEQEELHGLLHTARYLLEVGRSPIPAPRAKAANRARLLTQAVQERESSWYSVPRQRGQRPSLTARLPAPLRRGLVALALSLLLLFVVGSGAVAAAAGSLPGSVLYPLKLATENVRLGLAPSTPAQAQLYMHFANERTNEMVRLAKAQSPMDQAVVQRMAQQWQGALQAAVSAGGETTTGLLQAIVETSSAQHDTLLQVSAEASPDVQDVLQAGAAVAADAARQAQDMLQQPARPAVTPMATATLSPTELPTMPLVVVPTRATTPTATVTPTASPQPEPDAPGNRHTPAILPVGSITPSLSATPSPTARVPVPFTATPIGTQTLRPTGTPSATRRATSTPSPTPATGTPTATAPPVTPTPSETAEPTATPQAVFHVTNTAHAAVVPATHRIHYVICVVNDGEARLTNVVLVSRWSPQECVYLPPNNPTDKTWVIGTVAPSTRHCVLLELSTYSTCGGRTVTNTAEVTCDQGTASAVAFTRIGPTPGPAASPTATLTPTTTVTAQITETATPTPTATGTETPAPSPTLGTPP